MTAENEIGDPGVIIQALVDRIEAMVGQRNEIMNSLTVAQAEVTRLKRQNTAQADRIKDLEAKVTEATPTEGASSA